MTGRRHRFEWLPPALVGACAGIAAEVAMGILLYAGPGFVRSLTTVLAVEAGALAAGLWTAPPPGPDLVDRLRRRWLLCLTAFLVAAAFGTAWSAAQGFGGGAAGQGLGLALLAALPLYACGSVIGGMASVAVDDPSERRRGPGGAAALGAAAGFVITGVLLPRAPIPASLLVGCLVLLSGAGMVYGAVLGRRLQIHVRASRPSPGGEVRVEDHRLTRAALAFRLLLEGGHVRRRARFDDEPDTPWDVAVAKAVAPPPEAGWRVLLVGGGASALPGVVTEQHPGASLLVLERTGAVVELARDHLGTGLWPGTGDRVDVRVGNLEDLVREAPGPFDLVLVDTGALAPLGGMSALSRAARGALVSALAEAGLMVWGPGAGAGIAGTLGDGWQHVVLHREGLGYDETVVLSRMGAPPPAADGVANFVRVDGGPRPT